MTTAKRAKPSQDRIMRAVAGAVKNTADAHPHWNINRSIAKSIAKRAAGTLASQWGGVLAAVPSEVGSHEAWQHEPTPSSSSAALQGGVIPVLAPSRDHRVLRRKSLLKVLWKQIATDMWRHKKDGNMCKVEALIEVLRQIDQLDKGAV